MEQRQALITALRKDYGLDLDAAINDVRRYMPGLNEKKFREAFYFAAKAHDGQFRKENKPYMVHPFETARILISFHADEDTLIAAFLHDVPEDTSHTIDEIEKRFGKKVAFLVNGVTKLTKVHYRNDMAGRQVESLKKLFLYTAEDPRIILIKLADRLHNMRTLQHIDKPEKRVRISRETLEIFVPVANLLGIEELKAELEDLCFRYLYPDEYESVADRMQRSRDKNKKVMEETIELIHRELEKSNLKAVIYGRQKNLYGLYKKIISQGKRMDEFDDFIALRILVQEREDCYKVLGILHTLFNPKPGKFRDYISVPKANGYQSLHTTVFGLKGIITEFQIRTNQMHLEAEYGTVARHFDHFEKGGNQDATNLRRSGWMEKIREMEKAQRPQESFLDNLKGDILQDRIFVFTPLGEPIDLPREATCIDFAYAVHTEVGNRALKADINGEILPITTVLKTGDVVRIITSDRAKGPNREWLSFAKTNSARSKIREYFQKESMESKIHLGRQLLQKEYDRAGIGMVRVIPQKKVRDFAEKFPELRLENFNDVLVAIGEGTLGTLDLMHCLYPIRGGALISQRHSVLEFLHLRPIRKKTRVNVRISFDEDRPGQMESLLLVISKFNINILKTEGYLSPFRRVFLCKFVLEIESFQQLSELFENLENVQGVNRVERQFWKRKLTFLIVSMFSFGLWLIHPFIMSFAKNSMLAQNNPVTELFQYFSFFVLFVEVFILKSISARSFPELRETTAYWIMSFLLTAFALITFFSENYFLQLSFNWVVIFGLIVFIVAYQIAEYINANDRS